MMEMTPQYNTMTFCDIWDSYEKFNSDWTASIYYQRVFDEVDRELVYYLLYSRYGNNPIANLDVNQWKMKVFSIMFQYGPTWQKRLNIQKDLRSLSEDELLAGSRAIYNHALNPNTVPDTESEVILPYINDQNTTKYKRSKIDAYGALWEVLRVDVTESFLGQFKKLFKVFVRPEEVLLYSTDVEEA